MYFIKATLFICLVYLLNTNVNAKQRFICSREDTNEVVNFYISENKLFLSGLSISGIYSVLIKNKSGVLAMNMSSIGDESGIEVIFIDLYIKKFVVKSSITNIKKNKFIEVKGNCK